ncbi:hypothetical protein CCYA_CCYA09G2526 [Cyanidiococcus yangmingshanensis]|nr:hypothetical protein CCYA_CCYA09G2526 [Cyanidiococcus yangmingshanensis]
MSPCPFAQQLASLSSTSEFAHQEARESEAQSAQCPFRQARGSTAAAIAAGVDDWTHARSESVLCPVCHTPPVPQADGYAIAVPCTHVYCGVCAASGVRDCLLCAATIAAFVRGPEHVKEEALFEDIRKTARTYLTLRAARQCVLLGVQRQEPWLLEAAVQTYARELESDGAEADNEHWVRDRSTAQSLANTDVAALHGDVLDSSTEQRLAIMNASDSATDPLDAEWLSRTGSNTRALYAVTCGVLTEMKLRAAPPTTDEERRRCTREAYRYARTAVDLLFDVEWTRSPVMQQALFQSLIRLEWAVGLLRETYMSILTPRAG